jgi:DNA-binding transcriptional ArsR family regulator
MTKKSSVPNLDLLFEALANKHRREIIHALGLQPYSISQLAALRQLSLPAIHKHIKILQNSELITEKKISRTHFLTLNRKTLLGLQDWLMEFQAHWGTEKESLENYISFLSEKNRKEVKNK